MSPWHGIIFCFSITNKLCTPIEMQSWIKNPIIYQFQLLLSPLWHDFTSILFIFFFFEEYTFWCHFRIKFGTQKKGEKKRRKSIFLKNVSLEIAYASKIDPDTIFIIIFLLHYQKVVRHKAQIWVLRLQSAMIEKKKYHTCWLAK